MLQILAIPWSAPGWMKDVNSLNGNTFDDAYAEVYARYLARYVAAYRERGVNIHYIVPQNEPLHAVNGYPTMHLSAESEASLTK